MLIRDIRHWLENGEPLTRTCSEAADAWIPLLESRRADDPYDQDTVCTCVLLEVIAKEHIFHI